MEPHLNSYSNSGIPCIEGQTYRLYDSRTTEAGTDFQTLQFLHLLPHLQLNDVSTGRNNGGKMAEM